MTPISLGEMSFQAKALCNKAFSDTKHVKHDNEPLISNWFNTAVRIYTFTPFYTSVQSSEDWDDESISEEKKGFQAQPKFKQR